MNQSNQTFYQVPGMDNRSYAIGYFDALCDIEEVITSKSQDKRTPEQAALAKVLFEGIGLIKASMMKAYNIPPRKTHPDVGGPH